MTSWKSPHAPGNVPTRVRPLTNNDPGNVFPTGFGLPRPMKHYRKGRVIISAAEMDALPPSVARNVQRSVRSSVIGTVQQLMEQPGSFIVHQDPSSSSSCHKNMVPKVSTIPGGNCVVSDWEHTPNATIKPQSNVCNGVLCCNEERKARRRVLPPNTNVSNQYFQTTYMKLYNRCQTFQQRQFNFVRGLGRLFDQYPEVTEQMLKSREDTYYVAQCVPQEQGVIREMARQLAADGVIPAEVASQSNLSINALLTILPPDVRAKVMQVAHQSFSKQCARVYYKPNNSQFASQGAVSSSQRTLKLTVDTLNASNTPENQMATAIQYGFRPTDVFITKQKIEQPCTR